MASLVAALLLAGGAAAQLETAANDSPSASQDAASHVRYRLEPREIWIRAGQESHAMLGAQSERDVNVSFALSGAPGPLAAKLTHEKLAVVGGAWDGKTEIVLVASDDAKPGDQRLKLVATTDAGEPQAFEILVHVIARERPYEAKPTATAARPAPAPYSWAMAFDPHEAKAKPGETVTAKLLLKARNATTVKLITPAAQPATLASDNVTIAPGEPTVVPVTIAVPSDAKGDLSIVVYGTDGSERHDARFLIHVVRATTEPKPEPKADAQALFLRALNAYLGEKGYQGHHKVVILVVDDEGRIATLDPGSSP